MTMMSAIRRSCRRLAASRAGAASVEFLLVTPVLMVMFVGVVDIGNVLVTQFRLSAAVASGVNYSIVRSDDVGTGSATALASTMAKLVASSSQTDTVTATVRVNNGPTATVIGSGNPSVSGTASDDTNGKCYCPTPGSDWGVVKNCKANCTGTGKAGRFVRITASKPYTALFSSYGIVSNGTISATNIVQTE